MRSRLSGSAAIALALWPLLVPGSLAGRGRIDSRPQAAERSDPVGVRETLLARLDPDADLQTISVDPLTIRRVSWISGGKGSQRMVLDGVPGPVFDRVVSPYPAREAALNNLVWWWPEAQDCVSMFSLDGSRAAYAAKRGKWFVVADGVEHGPYDAVLGLPAFSPDGTHATWEARVRGKLVRVVDGVVHGPFENRLDALSRRGVDYFSPDSRRVAFPARMREGGRTVERMIVDGANGPPHRMVGNPHFSPDSRHLAYWAHAEGQRGLQLMVDDKPVAHTTKASRELLDVFDNVLSDSRLPFAPDEAHLAFATERDGRLRAVVHGKEGPSCDWVSPLAFNADYTRSAYVIGFKRDPLSLLAAWVTGPGGDYKYRLVVDGIERREGDSPIAAPVMLAANGRHAPVYLSPDGKRLAYRTERGVVVDGAAVSRRGESASDAAFSPDGARVAYSVTRGGRTFVTIDGAEGSAADFDKRMTMRVFGRRTLLTFSPDGRHVVYAFRHGSAERLGIDLGATTPAYDAIVGGMIAFETPAVVVFAARRGRDVLRVEVDLASVTKPPA